MAGKSECRKAFTLVELLVVVAIISLLAGLLLPVLEEAINTAGTIECNNNLRTTGQAFFMYTEDHHGTLPHRYKSEDGWVDWWDLMQPYTNKYYGCNEKKYRNDYGISGIEANQGYCSLYNCTWYLDTMHGGAGWDRCDVVRNNYYHILTYGANKWLCDTDRDIPFIRQAELKSPSDLIMVIESRSATTGSFEGAFFNSRHGSGAGVQTMAPCGEMVWHDGQAPAVHNDGHVESYGVEDCTSSSYTNRYQPHNAPEEQVRRWGLYLTRSW